MSKNSRLVGHKCEFAERSLVVDSPRQHRHICGFPIDGIRLHSPAHRSDRAGTRTTEQFQQRATGLAGHFQQRSYSSTGLCEGCPTPGRVNVPDIPHLPAALVEKKENGEPGTRSVTARRKIQMELCQRPVGQLATASSSEAATHCRAPSSRPLCFRPNNSRKGPLPPSARSMMS